MDCGSPVTTPRNGSAAGSSSVGPGERYTLSQVMSTPRSPRRKTGGFQMDSPPRPVKSQGGFRTRMLNSNESDAPPFRTSCDEGTERFSREFEGARIVGSGHFSVVYRARNRVDKQEYAIKKTKNALARGAERRMETLQEALALAAVATECACPYIVRYFSSWIEDERLFIQTELCDGSLKDRLIFLQSSRPNDPRLDEEELSAVIRDVCMGLGVLHGKNLVHLDVKPENILVKNIAATDSAVASRVHKIADLGLATAAIGTGCDELSEGDSRYLARELLRSVPSDLTKADVFSLGLLCYELATNPKELPCNGDEWHQLRDGFIEEQIMDHLSYEMLALVRSMLRPNPVDRPACADMLRDPALSHQRLSGDDTFLVQELHQQLRHKTEVAENERRMRADAEQKMAFAEQKMATAEEKADRYWSELVHMKRQEMLREAPLLHEAPHAEAALAPQPPADGHQFFVATRTCRRRVTA